MNILFFTLEYPPFKGGVANYYYNVVKYWPKNDVIFVLTQDTQFIKETKEVSKQEKIIRPPLSKRLIKNWFYPKWLPALYYLYKEIKTKKINHILVGQILPLGTVTYLITRLTKTPYSIFVHGMDFTYAQKSDRKAKITKIILSKAVQIICTNNYTSKLINNAYDEKFSSKIHIVNPGINAEFPIHDGDLKINEIKEKYKLENKIILFSIGRLVKRKGFDKVIETVPEVLKVIPDLIYIIAGAGPDEEYLKLLSKNNIAEPINRSEGINQSILFLGSITDDEKWTWLKICDIFITTSRRINDDFEGFGIVYLEANLAGKPVIAGNSGGVSDAVQNNINGLLINPESGNEIASAVIKLARDENLRRKLGEQGRDRALKDFGWSDKINEIYKIIN